MRLTGIAAFVCLLAATPALATGGLSCDIDDPNLKLHVEAGYSYSIPGLIGVSGSMQPLVGEIPDQLRKIDVTAATLREHWTEGPDIRLLVYQETSGDAPFGSVKLVIITTQSPDDELTFTGVYRMELFLAESTEGADNQISRTGSVLCQSG